jgi:hypothetical protein
VGSSRRVILPGEKPRKSNLQILVPKGYESAEPPPIVGQCSLCELVFYDQDEARRHFERNARKHAEMANEMRQERLEERMPVFEEWDPEVAAHLRKVGERMVAEGRLEVKPSERAGFS